VVGVSWVLAKSEHDWLVPYLVVRLGVR